MKETSMTENFGDTPEEFDLDAWIEQGTRAQRTVKVYRDWSLMDQLTTIEAQIATAEQETDPSPADVGADELREQYEALVGKLAESAIDVTLRSLTNEEAATVTAGIPDVEQAFRDQSGKEQSRWKPDRVAIGDALVAEAAVSPRMTRDQVRKMRERLGDGPMQVLFNTVAELRAAGQELPSIPFLGESSDATQE